MELIIPISDDAFRPKVRACINGYLGISENYSLTFGLYRKGVTYVFGQGDNISSLRYNIGSISKTMTAHLILYLRDMGLLKLDKSVSQYLSLPRGSYPTLYQLLTHTA